MLLMTILDLFSRQPKERLPILDYMDLIELMKFKKKNWHLNENRLRNELPKVKNDFREVIRTKDAKTLRQKNIQNNISQFESEIFELEKFVSNIAGYSAIIESPKDTIGEGALYRINRSYSSVRDASLLTRRPEPKDHFVFRLPIVTSLLGDETPFGYFEETQTSLSSSTSFDGLRRGEIFCFDA